MSLEELKQKAIELVKQQDDNAKLEKVLALLSANFENQFTADEVFERTAIKFDNTLQKLA